MKQVITRFKASLALKFTVIAAVMLLFIGLYIYDGFRFTRHIKGEATLIEKAGNLRFRSFEMAWWLRRIAAEQATEAKKEHMKYLVFEAGKFDEIAAFLITAFKAKDKERYGEAAKELDRLVDIWNKDLKQLVLSIPESSGYNQKLLLDKYEAVIHSYVDEVDMFVKVQALHMESELDAYSSRRAASLAVLAGIFILGISFVVKGIIAPIRRLREATAKITGRDPDIDIDIDIDRRDELGEFAASFREMMLRLNAAFNQLRQDRDTLKKVETELRERNLLLQTLIDSIPDMFYFKNIHGRYMIVNGAFARFAGLIKEEIAGKPPEELFPPDTAKDVRESDEVILRAAEPLRFEYPTADKQGNKKVLDIVKTPVLSASGEVIGMLGVLRDITEEKEIGDTIKRSLDFYLDIFNKFPQPFRRTDSLGRCNYVNQAWLRLTGQEFEETLYYGWTETLHTGDRERTIKEFLTAFNARQPAVLNYRIHSRDGQDRWLIEYGAPFSGMDGKFAGYICFCYDFTERRNLEAALAQSENLFRQFFDQNEIAIMLLNPKDCAICGANQSAVELYGYTLEELIAQGLALFVSPLLLERFKEFVRSSILSQGAEGFSLLPQFHTKKDGSSAIVVVHAKSIRLSPEEPPVLYCSFFDITATIRLQEEGKIRQAQLIHSNKMASVGLMISGIVHEINNPNAFIMSNAQLMQDISREVLQLLERLYKAQPDISLAGLSFPEVREAAPRLVSGIIDASSRINEIVRNIGDFVRPESDEMEKKFDINSAILTSVAILTNQIKKCTDNFHLDLNKGLPLIRGSRQKLEQVIINLVMNSLQALPDRGRGVYISTAMDKEVDCVIIEVRDEGKGMQEENMNRIKEPFFTTRSEAGGTGLGLFISDEIIRKHNGSLSFESEQGKGTTAIIRLPLESEL